MRASKSPNRLRESQREGLTPLKALNIVESRCIRMTIKTAAQARKLFAREAERLHEETGTQFMKEELLSEEFYETNPNPTIRAVADFFNGKEENKWADCSPEARRCIKRVREQLAKLEMERVHPWRALTEVKKMKEKECFEDQIDNISKAIVAHLLKHISKNRLADRSSWKERITWCKSPKDFKLLFSLLNLEESQWSNVSWMQLNRYGKLQKDILKHLNFSDWSEFQRYMGIFTTWIAGVEQSNTKEDFLCLMKKRGIRVADKKWLSTVWLAENGYGGFYNAVLRDSRFKYWEDFCEFMGESKSWIGKISKCKTRADFLKLAKNHNFPNMKEWKFPGKLPVGFRNAILNDDRFSDWDSFLGFMKIIDDSDRSEVKRCKNSAQFLSLFRKRGIKNNEWHSSTWMQLNGHQNLYVVIARKDERFKGWADFKKFMGLSISIPVPEVVSSCTTPAHFLKLFRSHGARGSEWKNSRYWQARCYPMYQAIRDDSRFNGWFNFLKFMGEDVTENLSATIRELTSPQEFRKFFKKRKIPVSIWQNSSKLGHSNSGLCQAITKRFGKWRSFLTFMEIIQEPSLTDQVRSCKSPKSFLSFFQLFEIPRDEWQSSGWLHKNGFSNIVSAIYADSRFPSWSVFLAFMDGRLPAKPIESAEQARQLIDKEIRRLRSEVCWVTQLPKKAPVTRQEIEELLSDKYYKKNGVSRAIADFYRHQQTHS